MTNITGVIFTSLGGFMKLVKLNLLFIVAVIAGLGVFSFFPALVAMTAVTKSWARGEDVPIFRKFMEVFRSRYKRAQLFGVMTTVVAVILIVDIVALRTVQTAWSDALIVALFGITFLSIAFSVFTIQLLVDVPFKQAMKRAFFTMMACLHWCVVLILGLTAIAATVLFYPVSLLFLPCACMALWSTCITQIAFMSVEKRAERFNQETVSS
ncbi:DUF624 domain-containing protein [Paenalkalicoccus suaedae]|uniref:DUF624 domain-containing protein n=1 Tax=Paenalkalicoccus suaedae TaxID=2592382 RepID=A0A859FJD9_9BACI|nr:DUF624 domain-containing protein [Paenalkalicoccus suaedae]QKS72845.1 DUF624 domain-containing protein [Paenalkalicoccus suaedae]